MYTLASSKTSPCTTWYGVSCNNFGTVTRLNLSVSNVNGTLYRFPFSFLLNLTYVDFAINEFYGNIPSQIGPIPASFGRLSNLTNLYIYENKLSNSIPPEFSSLLNLVALFMDNNLLTGPIPSSFGSFTNVTYLHLFNNHLSGSIPSELGKYNESKKSTEESNDFYCIGKGGFGSVYKAKLQLDNIVAVKKLHSSTEIAESSGFINEVRALTEIRHPNIVKLLGYCSHSPHSFLVYEYLENGSLEAMLSKEVEAKELNWQMGAWKQC
ncbi:hypothetical protein POM88_010558 [Heracleum sosnowskyi]|uniref:non-specific serine/threonine protein kinase n=1 Tax=Heracleum sosnowskyi TaxID=360622 RepID=A0AAD8N0N1_9APIA|nr:hypothetical protein POM88_010558 [Heracleum sosnowskyi]